jgi:homopolymeric O-antigen transport system ATP-binding protein
MSIVIKVEDLWKQYRLGNIGHGTLRQDLQSWSARWLGKEDPNLGINSGLSQNSPSKESIWALQGVSLEIRQGDVVGIIGKNGSGKSTLFKILCRLTAPTRGEVKIRGRVAALLEVGTGFHPDLTGRENIFLNGTILGMTVGEIKRKFDGIVDFSGVEKFIDTPVKRYSSGMFVRLAFAVAAHLEPEIMIVDEVLAVGDGAFMKKCLEKMAEIAKEGRTILFVTHMLFAVEELCKTCYLLDYGNVVYSGPTKEVIDIYKEKYFG